MDTTEASGPSSPGTREKKYLSVRQAAFIGVGAMVGAGIFALLGAAGEVAGAAVWLSFLLAGYFFGQLPAVKRNFQFVILGIIVISLVPVVTEFLKARRQAAAG
jgi:membrane protein DedA with SNARE-associated domain